MGAKGKMGFATSPSLFGFVGRFTLVHVVTYTVTGLIFLAITRYFDSFQADELLSQVMRPADSPMVRLAVPLQVLRGALLALAIYPVGDAIIGHRYGWLKLFALLWVLTGIGAVITGPGSIEGLIYTKFKWDNPLIGTPEITVQMLVFSYWFVRWQTKATRSRTLYTS